MYFLCLIFISVLLAFLIIHKYYKILACIAILMLLLFIIISKRINEITVPESSSAATFGTVIS